MLYNIRQMKKKEPKYANVRIREKTYSRIKEMAHAHEMPIVWFIDAMVSNYESQLNKRK